MSKLISIVAKIRAGGGGEERENPTKPHAEKDRREKKKAGKSRGQRRKRMGCKAGFSLCRARIKNAVRETK